MNNKKKEYTDSILQKVIDDYDKKFKQLKIEEESPYELENRFKSKAKEIIRQNRYEILISKIKKYKLFREKQLFFENK
jgi:hypothetical protein